MDEPPANRHIEGHVDGRGRRIRDPNEGRHDAHVGLGDKLLSEVRLLPPEREDARHSDGTTDRHVEAVGHRNAERGEPARKGERR